MAKVEKEKKEKKHFLKDFKAELKKVIWPTSKQVINNTTAVIVIVLITALIVFVLDVAFEVLNTQGVDRLKSVIKKDENSITNLLENTVDNTITINDTNSIQENTVSE